MIFDDIRSRWAAELGDTRLAELEAILAGLEREAVDVDHLAERVQRAAALIRLCRGRLASARIEIETVLTDLERATDDDGT